MSEENVIDFTDQEQVSFNLILLAGNARSEAFAALEEAKKNNWDGAKTCFKKANEEMKSAHEIQAKLLQSFAGGAKITPDLLLVHAQDHLMTAKSEIGLIEELIELNRKIANNCH